MAYATLATWDMLRLGTITESPKGSMLVGIGPLFWLRTQEPDYLNSTSDMFVKHGWCW